MLDPRLRFLICWEQTVTTTATEIQGAAIAWELHVLPTVHAADPFGNQNLQTLFVVGRAGPTEHGQARHQEPEEPHSEVAANAELMIQGYGIHVTR